jgi:hypothetical protein
MSIEELTFVPKRGPIIEMIAKQLHENYRATCKAMGVPHSPPSHDHGYGDCGNRKKEYFRKRAYLLLKRAKNLTPETLGEAESNMQALVFLKRTHVGL